MAEQTTTSGSAVTTRNRAAVAITGLSKVYPGTRALDAVDLEVREGEVHGLCGGNGSGKSTLIKILCGVVDGDAGTIDIGGQSLDVSELKPQLVHDLGIRVVHQDLAIFPDLSIAENMAFGSEFPQRAAGRVNWRELKRRAAEQIERFDINAEPGDLVRDLPMATRAQVAIARALQDVEPGKGLVILDEPTASLPEHEAKLLHAAIRQLGRTGHAVLFVSHRLDEVLALTDRVTVFRDGRVAATHQTAQLTEQELIESILGKRAEEIVSGQAVPEDSPVVLDVKKLTAGPLRDVDLQIKAGEVVGIAGMLGSGRSELLRALYGDLRRDSGTVVVNGKPANFSRMDQAIASGVVMIPENRVMDGVFPGLTVDENMQVSVLRRYWRIFFRKGTLDRDADTLRTRFKVKTPSGKVFIGALSGGNQQKTILARWLRRDPVLLLLDEPTQGVDVGARADIYSAVREVTDGGGAAIVVASDLEELAQVVDRAIVLRNGRVVAHVPQSALTAQRLSELVHTAPGTVVPV